MAYGENCKEAPERVKGTTDGRKLFVDKPLSFRNKESELATQASTLKIPRQYR
jgi:hypothetical protein